MDCCDVVLLGYLVVVERVIVDCSDDDIAMSLFVCTYWPNVHYSSIVIG